MNIKGLVFDIDGTLIPYGKTKIENSALASIQVAKEKGYKIIIATGRNYCFLDEQIKEELKPDYFITVNGTCVLDSNANILEAFCFSKKSMDLMLECTKKENHLIGFKYSDCIVVLNDHNKFRDYYQVSGKDKHLIQDGENPQYAKRLKDEQPLGAYLVNGKEDDEFSKIPDISFVKAHISDYDIFPKEVNKATGLNSALKLLGLSWDEVMAFGDGENDIEMLTNAKIGVAMGNAKDRLKQCADYISTDITDNGIKNALIHFNII